MDKPNGKKLNKDSIKNLKKLIKDMGKGDTEWTSTTDIELAEELRRYCNAV